MSDKLVHTVFKKPLPLNRKLFIILTLKITLEHTIIHTYIYDNLY